MEDALDAQGFLPEGLGSEAKGNQVELPKGKAKPRKKPKCDPVFCDRNHPYAHHGVVVVIMVIVITIFPELVWLEKKFVAAHSLL